MNKTFYKPYVSVFLKTGLLALAVLLICIFVLLQGMVTETQVPHTLGSIVKTKSILTQLKKQPQEFNFVTPQDANQNMNVKVICNPGCVITLSDKNYTGEIPPYSQNDEPLKITDKNGYDLWQIPARVLAADTVYASKLGTVVWDQTKSTIVYEVISSTLEEKHSKVYVWQYTQDWAMGLKHWFNQTTGKNNYYITGYDSSNGFIEVSDHNHNNLPVFALSVSDPILIDL